MPPPSLVKQLKKQGNRKKRIFTDKIIDYKLMYNPNYVKQHYPTNWLNGINCDKTILKPTI